MKTIKLFILFLIISHTGYSQDTKIDSTNYCNFYDNTTHRKNSNIKSFSLSETMIIDIVSNEMEKLGYKWISKFRIIKLDEDKYVTSICYSDKSNCGFLLESITESLPSQEDRNLKSLNKKHSEFDYSEKIISTNGDYKFVNIKEIPKNLHILKRSDYWYQQSLNPEKNKKLVSKEFIIELLKNDVRKFLKGYTP